jgi:ABC-type lipoprotein export system ATPase subunit
MSSDLLVFDGVGLQEQPSGRTVIDSLSFRLAAGRALVIAGPPASGKSAALDLACGVIQPTTGIITRRDATLGWLPQAGSLASNLTLWDNVALPLRWHRRADDAAVEDAIHRLSDVMECEPPQRLPTANASPERRAVAAVARALILRPDLLIADEPGGELGADGREDLWRMLWRVHAEWGTAILATTTDPGPSEALTDQRIDLRGPPTMAFRLWRGAWG